MYKQRHKTMPISREKESRIYGLTGFQGANFTLCSDVDQANSHLMCFGVQEYRDINNCIIFMLKAP